MALVWDTEISQQWRPKSWNIENRRGKIDIFGWKREEVQAYHMGSHGLDIELIGSRSSENSGCVVESRWIRRRVLVFARYLWSCREKEGIWIGSRVTNKNPVFHRYISCWSTEYQIIIWRREFCWEELKGGEKEKKKREFCRKLEILHWLDLMSDWNYRVMWTFADDNEKRFRMKRVVNLLWGWSWEASQLYSTLLVCAWI